MNFLDWTRELIFVAWGLVVIWKSSVHTLPVRTYRDAPPDVPSFLIANILAFLGCVLMEVSMRYSSIGLKGMWPMWPVALLFMLTNISFPMVLHRITVGHIPRLLDITFIVLQFLSVVRLGVKKDFKGVVITMAVAVALCTPLRRVGQISYVLGGLVFEPYVGTAGAPAWHGLLFMIIQFQDLAIKTWYRVTDGQDTGQGFGHPEKVFCFLILFHAWIRRSFIQVF